MNESMQIAWADWANADRVSFDHTNPTVNPYSGKWEPRLKLHHWGRIPDPKKYTGPMVRMEVASEKPQEVLTPLVLQSEPPKRSLKDNVECTVGALGMAALFLMLLPFLLLIGLVITVLES